MEKILLACFRSKESEERSKSFITEFKKKGIHVDINEVFLLSDIEELLDKDKSYGLLILKNTLEDNNLIKPEYLYNLRCKFPQLKIIYVIAEKYYKTSYIKRIFDSNIYNCIFEKDVNIENIVYISLNPRTRYEAENYYGLIDNNRYDKGSSKKIGFPRGFKNEDTERSKNIDNIIIKEKIVYRIPKDYQKVIGIYSPYSVGKTVIASNLAKCYANNKLEVTLIDTDYLKKDILYYFPLNDEDFFKLVELYKDIDMKKEINDIDLYSIEVESRLKVFTDHRDANYKITFDMINAIVRSAESNLIIIDISSNLDTELVNEILALCDERVIIADKMISTLNGLPYKLLLEKMNRKKLSLVINRDVNIKGLSTNKLKAYFKNIEFSERERYSLNFDNIFFIPNKFQLIVQSMINREIAYEKDPEFDKSIINIATSLYQINNDSDKGDIKGLFKRLFN